ncbi:MAG: MaoC family dehydratase N-terminal domain-containing protein [Myxococcota bacterium]
MADGHEFHADRTGILTFAAALGETNRIYYDEAYAEGTGLGGVIAPPTFTASASHWNPSGGLRGVRRIPAPPPTPEGEGKPAAAPRAGGGTARLLHGEQRFEYHKPVRPGMRLTVKGRPGKTWEKAGRRGGKLRFAESISEYRDADGELVVTATGVSIITEKAVES